MQTSTTEATRGGVAEADSVLADDAARSDSNERLPTGTHGIPRELIEQNQRERIIAATVEVSSKQGYGATTVREVVRSAGVSTSTFYEIFGGLEECMLASFWELHGRLLEEVDVACREAPNGANKPRVALRRSLELFAVDEPAARLLTVEILGIGTKGAAAQHRAIAETANRIGLTGPAGRGVVGMVTSLIAERVVGLETASIPSLETELDPFLRAYQASR